MNICLPITQLYACAGLKVVFPVSPYFLHLPSVYSHMLSAITIATASLTFKRLSADRFI
jgi:hypothetical protein